MIEKLISGGLWLSDRLHFDPYEDFSRDFFPAGDKTLAQICAEAEDDSKDFKIFGGRVMVNRIPRDGSIDTGDQATWHGVYTAIKAFRLAVVEDQETGLELANFVDGLRLHQPVKNDGIYVEDPTRMGPYLCRGVRPYDLAVQWDASNDSGCGHLAGLWWAWLHGGDFVRKLASELLDIWAIGVHNAGGKLVNPDGKATEFGTLENGALTDPLRITLLMAIYGAAYRVTGDSYLRLAGIRAARLYHSLIPYAKARWWKFDNHTDTHRAAIQLRIMSECGMYEAWRPEINEGMRRLWAIGYRQANPWVLLMAMPASGDDRIRTKWMVKGLLSEFSVANKRWNTPVNSIDPSNPTWTVPFRHLSAYWRGRVVKFAGAYRAVQPIPLYARGSQDFFWQRHPYSVVDWTGYGDGDTRHNSMDFLGPYWLGRKLGILTEED